MSLALKIVEETETWAQSYVPPAQAVQFADWGDATPLIGDRIHVSGAAGTAQGIVKSRTWRHLELTVGIKGVVVGP